MWPNIQGCKGEGASSLRAGVGCDVGSCGHMHTMLLRLSHHGIELPGTLLAATGRLYVHTASCERLCQHDGVAAAAAAASILPLTAACHTKELVRAAAASILCWGSVYLAVYPCRHLLTGAVCYLPVLLCFYVCRCSTVRCAWCPMWVCLSAQPWVMVSTSPAGGNPRSPTQAPWAWSQ
jgi:hypothetical protein